MVPFSFWFPCNQRGWLIGLLRAVPSAGQIGSVVAVDHSLSPPSYVVRMAQTGDEADRLANARDWGVLAVVVNSNGIPFWGR